jgi:hypothetical protein
VRIDQSRVYPKEVFALGSVQASDQRWTDLFFERVTDGVKKVSAGAAPPRYPVIVTCFVDKIGDAAPQEWKMDQLTTVIPKKLAFRLANEKPFGNLFPVSFVDKCPFGPTERANYRQIYEEHWFAWTGTLSLRGNKINIVIDFTHDINHQAMPGSTEWARASSAVDVYAIDNEKAFIETVIADWENYLKAVRARRTDLPQVESN